MNKLVEEPKWSWVGIAINIDKICIGTNMNTHADKTEPSKNQSIAKNTIRKINLNDYSFF